MAFDQIPKIEDVQFYLDTAFSRARKEVAQTRDSAKGKRIDKSKNIEIKRIEIVEKTLNTHMMMILKNFPSIDNSEEFYKELIKCCFDYVALKKALGSANWSLGRISTISKFYIRKIKKTDEITNVNSLRNECYGRISSIMKQISGPLKYLEEVRKGMRSFPAIKKMFTVAISGFPNVGKSTLLSKMTPSKVEINDYSFTTKSILVGYLKEGYKKIQMIDTPGTLNRFDKMNQIEKQAALAIKYCADLIIYVFDLTEPYSLQDQKKLYSKLKDLDKNMIVYLSKTDILEKEKVDEFIKSSKISAPLFTDHHEMEKKIFESFEENKI